VVAASFFDRHWPDSHTLISLRTFVRHSRLIRIGNRERGARWRRRLPNVVREMKIDVPDGIIAHLSRECGGDVHDCSIIDVTCGSFETETQGASPFSGAYYNFPWNAAKNVAFLDNALCFQSAYRDKKEDIPHTRSNWLCYNFKERRIVPSYYAICTHSLVPGSLHLK
jgi:hypothetical protein